MRINRGSGRSRMPRWRAGMEEHNSDAKQKLKGGARYKYLLIRAIYKPFSIIVGILPERANYGLFVWLALLGYKHFPKFRQLARRQLETAFGGEKSPEEIEAILKQVYVNQGKNLAEFMMIPHKNAAWVDRHIILNDPHDVLRAEPAKGKGMVAVGAHIGNIELVCAWLGMKKIPMVTVIKAQRDSAVMDIIMETRNKWGHEMIFRARGVRRECERQLGMNKIIGLVADQNAASNGVFVDYFGKKAATVTGPADIAMRAGLPVVPGFLTTRNPDNTLTLHMLAPIPMRDTGDRDADLAYNVQLYTSAIEEFVRKYPEEYLWWHQRWKTRPTEEA